MSLLNVILTSGLIVESVALILEVYRSGKHSYSSALREENERLRAEKVELKAESSKLLDRILHLTTGAPLVVPEPKPLTAEDKAAIRQMVDKGSKPFGGYPNFTSLLAGMEAASLERDLRRTAGYEEVQSGAEVENSKAESTEAEEEQRAALQKVTNDALEVAKNEYLSNVPPRN